MSKKIIPLSFVITQKAVDSEPIDIHECGNIIVKVEDEGGGPFLIIQDAVDSEQSIRLNFDEVDVVVQACKMLEAAVEEQKQSNEV